MHCNPAPPHPPPGEIYNVICPPVIVGNVFVSWAVSFAVLLMLALALAGITYYFGDSGR